VRDVEWRQIFDLAFPDDLHAFSVDPGWDRICPDGRA
jgi:hypothetical protein